MQTNLLAPAHAPLATRSWIDRAMYPFASRFTPLDAGAMHYVDEGHGDPVLFVHGTPTWSFLWRHQVAALARTHRAMAIDHIGFGLSDKPSRDAFAYTPAAHAENLAAFVNRLDLERITLVAHDFGGPIAMAFALAHPDRVARIAIMNTWMWPIDDARTRRISRFVAGPLGRLLYLGLNASPRWVLPSAYGDRTKLTPGIHRHYMAPFAQRQERCGPWVLGRELTGSDAFFASLWERRARIAHLPMLVAWGMRDPAFGPAYRARWLDAFPHARTCDFPHAGHFVQEEAAPALTDALMAFTASRSRTPGHSTPID